MHGEGGDDSASLMQALIELTQSELPAELHLSSADEIGKPSHDQCA